METQTKPGLQEPKNPSRVALDTEDSSRIDVCVQENTFRVRLVHVYIRDLGIDIDALLEDAEYLESRVFEGVNSSELRGRFLESTEGLRYLVDFERPDGAYLLEYDLRLKENVYGALREL